MGTLLPKLTENRVRILQSAAADRLGLVSNPIIQGFGRVAWEKNAAYLVVWGLLSPYVHGGYEITEAGRAAIAKAEGRA